MIIANALSIAKIISEAHHQIDESLLGRDIDIEQILVDLNKLKRGLFEKSHLWEIRFGNFYNNKPSFYDWLQIIQVKYEISEELLTSITVDEAVEKAGGFCDDFSAPNIIFRGDFEHYGSVMISLRHDCSLISIFTTDKNEKSYKEGRLDAQNQKCWLFRVSIGLEPYDVDEDYEIFKEDSWNEDYLYKSKNYRGGYYNLELIKTPWAS